MSGPKTYFDRVWDDHVVARLGDESDLLFIDRLFLHERSGSFTIRQMNASGRTASRPELVFVVTDHLVDTAPGRGPEDSLAAAGKGMIRTVREGARKYGFHLFDIGDPHQGIIHVVSPEYGLALPGVTLVCGDSHTCTVGGVGALGWGIGSTESEHVAITQTLPQTRPRNMRVRFEGAVPKGVYPKDMILALIGKAGVNAGIDYAVEFSGSAIAGMPVEGRLTICNMAIEFSAKYGFVPPDDTTFEYLCGREFSPHGRDWDVAVDYWRRLRSDDDAVFERDLEIDCSALEPQVTWGTSPEHVVAIGGRVPGIETELPTNKREAASRACEYMQLTPGASLTDIPIDAAYVGSCTNARVSDLRIAAAILDGRKVKPGVAAICVPGSTEVKRQAEAEGLDRIFKAAGFEWHESACAMCGHLGNDRLQDLRVISTTNRNFEGRQGPRTRTHLASPATVAASAVTGRITDARTMC